MDYTNYWFHLCQPLELTFGFIELGDNKIQSNRQNKVVAAVERFQKKVPSVKFLLEKNVSDATVRITFDHKHPRGKTWSQVGMDVARVSSNEPTMNLSEVSGLGSGEIEEDSNEHGDIAHELLHTLGRVHEHQHPERKFTISISGPCPFDLYYDMELMVSPAVVKDTGWSEKDASDNVRKLRPDEVGAYSPLDGASNMMWALPRHTNTHWQFHSRYRIPGEWTDDGSEFQRNNKPSEVDWAWLNLMYPPQDQKLFEDALSKCGLNLNEECRKSILKLYLDGEWERVRSQLTRISNPSSNKSIMGKMWSKLVI